MKRVAWYYIGLCSGLVLGNLLRKRYDELGWKEVKDTMEKQHRERNNGYKIE